MSRSSSPTSELNHVLLDGVFYAAGRPYGIVSRATRPPSMNRACGCSTFDKDGSQLGLLPRRTTTRASNKNGGAWANAYVPQRACSAMKPVIANHLNIPSRRRASPRCSPMTKCGRPSMNSPRPSRDVLEREVPCVSGTERPRDFVEYPSRWNQMWATWPEVLKNYASTTRRARRIPEDLLEPVKAAEKFNSGLRRPNSSRRTHHRPPAPRGRPTRCRRATALRLRAARALEQGGNAFAPVPPRYRSTYHSHISRAILAPATTPTSGGGSPTPSASNG